MNRFAKYSEFSISKCEVFKRSHSGLRKRGFHTGVVAPYYILWLVTITIGRAWEKTGSSDNLALQSS